LSKSLTFRKIALLSISVFLVIITLMLDEGISSITSTSSGLFNILILLILSGVLFSFLYKVKPIVYSLFYSLSKGYEIFSRDVIT